jgi:hypothetical protein
MRALYVTAIAAALLLTPSVAQAKTYSLSYCGHQRGDNYYKVTAPSPGCSFGKAAYDPMMSFALSGRQHGDVRVKYRGRNYTLDCSLTSYGENVQCGRSGVPWVVLFLDSAEAPPSAFE